MRTTTSARQRFGRLHRLLMGLALLALLLAPAASAGGPTARGEAAPPEVTLLSTSPMPSADLDGALFRRAKADTGKLDAALASLAAPDVTAQSLGQMAAQQGVRLLGESAHVQIAIEPARETEIRQAVASLGGEITGASADGALLQGWVPVSQLQAAGAIGGVLRIKRPIEVELLDSPSIGASLTEGVAAMNAGAWHAQGLAGTGVRIGVIDGGFKGYKALLGSDLPASVSVANFSDGESPTEVDTTSSSPHGTACTEIIYDVAPGAQIFLAKVNTNIDLQEAVTWMINTNHVQIISTSLGWYNLSPGDGTGFFADVATQARNAGILWVSSASNDREAHWGGAWADADGDDILSINGDQEVDFFGPGDGSAYNIPAGYSIRVFVRWSDWTAVNQDFDLYLLRWSSSAGEWETVATSVDEQNGGSGQSPTEFLAYNTSGGAVPYGIAVAAYNRSRSVDLELFAPKVARLDEIVTARSLSNLADVPQVFTVAATDSHNPYPQESYSSEGPTNGPGGTIAGGSAKPDISGYANVTCTSYGVEGFNGTSSAAPHVAGAAALVLSAFPGYSPDQIRSVLQSRAIDLGAGGLDLQYGWGRVYMGNPPAAATATPTATLTPSRTPTITLTPTKTSTFRPVQRRGFLPMITRRGAR